MKLQVPNSRMIFQKKNFHDNSRIHLNFLGNLKIYFFFNFCFFLEIFKGSCPGPKFQFAFERFLG